jgi:hypothetical protein
LRFLAEARRSFCLCFLRGRRPLGRHSKPA